MRTPACIEVQGQFDIAAERRIEGAAVISRTCCGEVELFDNEAAAAGIGEHLAGELGGAFAGVAA